MTEISIGGRRRLFDPILAVAAIFFFIIVVVCLFWWFVLPALGNWFKGRRALSMESTKPTEKAMRRLLQAESSNTGNGGFTIDLDHIWKACKVSSVNLASWICQQSEEELLHFMGAAICGGALMETVCQVDLPALGALAHH